MKSKLFSSCSKGFFFTSTLAVVAGCGGNSPRSLSSNPLPSPNPPPSPAIVALTVSPSSDVLRPLATRTFKATEAVHWTVQESVGGSITSDGTYTAPVSTGTYHLVATSIADPNKTAIATIQVLESAFTSAGTLQRSRVGHTSTLLPNGKVLVAGGGWGSGTLFWDPLVSVSEAELFDPATGTSTIAGNVARSFATATLLPNSKVLITGGEFGWTGDPKSITLAATAEVYDPASGEFQTVGSMNEKRELHAAALLDDGRVLITGGEEGWPSKSSAEIFDPASRTFALTGTMGTRRDSHTSTLLKDGKVLIAGGNDYESSYGTASAELFDPATGTFSPTGSMAEGRAGHTATLLLSGDVLVTGGSKGGTAEIYHPASGTFSPAGPMVAARRTFHTATLLPDGRVLIAGGVIGIGDATYSAETYDPATNSFAPIGGMAKARYGHTAITLANGNVLLLGGSSLGYSFSPVNEAEIYK